MLIQREAHHIGVEVDPLIHLVPADVAHHVINMQQADRSRDGVGFHRAKTGKERAVVVTALHKCMNCVTVCADARKNCSSMFVFEHMRLGYTLRTAACGFSPGFRRVVDPKRDCTHTITVEANVFGDFVASAQCGGEDKTNLVLLNDV